MHSAESLFAEFIRLGASDLYFTVGAPPKLRVADTLIALGEVALTEEHITGLLTSLLDDEKMSEFESTLEYNTAFHWNDQARFRLNAFRQKQHTGIVIRRIQTQIPTLEALKLPKVYRELIMEKRGLVLVVGPTGSGKSTSLASMLEYRNQNSSGHILTVEDPVEYILEHKGCVITQRDVGIDTYSFGIALKNALRQRPDVVMIGEIRDRETMEQAIIFAETGHLCVATLHANNASQTIERVINFFPEEKHRQVLLNLSINVKGILSQRFVTHGEKRSLALEVLLNKGLIRNLIQEGKSKEIKDMLERNRDSGMQSFDQSLLDLYIQNVITEEMALGESDNPANLRLAIKQYDMSKKTIASKPAGMQGSPFREGGY